MKKYVEIGLGNIWFIRTEFENEDGREHEVKGIAGPIKPISFYLRLWLGRTVYILDLREGFKKQHKNRKAFKLLVGIASK
ncbi:DUF3977 family protein [Streptococcus sp. X16XC17]|uniref:DUF3977 family protein n=1 Tax=unclassified Streptococcus TaxID=2608887 RepID=UPI00066FF6F9|nr:MULTISPECIES: DUF3977 family protein [unclassified Streptococcus]TCD46121.1 DUF3977 family protein [Streptococcus sp. X16XC17]